MDNPSDLLFEQYGLQWDGLRVFRHAYSGPVSSRHLGHIR